MPEDTYTIDDVVNMIVAGDKVNLGAAVHDVMMQKAAQELEVQKVLIAQRFLDATPQSDDYEDDGEDTEE